jgi:hypothetical protein
MLIPAYAGVISKSRCALIRSIPHWLAGLQHAHDALLRFWMRQQ